MVIDTNMLYCLYPFEGTGLVGQYFVLIWGTGEQPLQIWPRLKHPFWYEGQVSSSSSSPCALMLLCTFWLQLGYDILVARISICEKEQAFMLGGDLRLCGKGMNGVLMCPSLVAGRWWWWWPVWSKPPLLCQGSSALTPNCELLVFWKGSELARILVWSLGKWRATLADSARVRRRRRIDKWGAHGQAWMRSTRWSGAGQMCGWTRDGSGSSEGLAREALHSCTWWESSRANSLGRSPRIHPISQVPYPVFPTLLFFCTLPNSSKKRRSGNVRRCSGHIIVECWWIWCKQGTHASRNYVHCISVLFVVCWVPYEYWFHEHEYPSSMPKRLSKRRNITRDPRLWQKWSLPCHMA